MVVRSLWAAERSSWVVGVVVGWVVVRPELVWPVSWDVVTAVDMGVPLEGMVVDDGDADIFVQAAS
jgi:hypothetical protein